MNKYPKNNKTPKRSFPVWAIILIVLTSFTFIGILFILGFFALKNTLVINETNPFPIVKNLDKDALKTNEKVIYDEKNKFETINPNYAYGNLSITEYPFHIDEKNKKDYFLGEHGHEILNNMFKLRANFGPEINALRKVYINKSFPEKSIWDGVNGLYLPTSSVIYINISNILKTYGYKVYDLTLEQRVELILSVLIHEYSHHIDNVYNQAVKPSDPYANNNYIDKRRNNEQISVNKKFTDNFIEALNYKIPNKYIETTQRIPNTNKLETVSTPLVRDNNDIRLNRGLFTEPNAIFSKFSNYDLFKIANVPLNKEEEKLYSLIDKNNFYFNNSSDNLIRFSDPVKLKDIKYSYSLAELFPRELLKMSYTSNPNLYYYNTDMFDNYLYFFNPENRKPYLTAIGDDIIKMVAPRAFKNNIKIYSSNWVFDSELKSFYSENNKYTFYKIKRNRALAQLFSAYVDLMGYRQAISYIGNNNWNLNDDLEYSPDKDNVNLAGYLKFKREDLNEKNVLKYKVSMLIGTNDDPKKNTKVSLNQTGYNYIAKSFWNQPYVNLNGVRGTYSEKDLYSLNSEENYEYVAYYSDSVAIKKLDSLTHNEKLNINLWIDRNKNNEIEADEVESILNNSSIISSEQNDYYNVEKHNKRTITNYRNYFYYASWTMPQRVISIKKDENNNQYFEFKYY
ncbi:MYPU_1760 family metalloprotease [Metamycoplasma spumans]|uniref:MYPU_1760 family metalloprotease n=1 Tax=Metamycoplasma spumans TaxID=92406 RepID=UPI0034DD950F